MPAASSSARAAFTSTGSAVGSLHVAPPSTDEPRASERPRPASQPHALNSPSLARQAPLVPVDSLSARALVAVIAIMAFLAALCGAAAEMAASSATAWQDSVSREATIQVRPRPGRDLGADVAEAAALARSAPGIADARVVPEAEGARLLEPWLGSGLDLGDLPIPRLVAVRLAADVRPDLAALRRSLAERVPGATLDDHGLWLRRLSTMATTVVGIGVGLVLLVLAATGLAVAFATRGTMAGNREVVDVLHLVGARDGFIAREFGNRFFRLGLKGGAIGGGAALAAVGGLHLLSASWRASAAGDQVEALFGAFEVSPRGFAAVAAVAVAVAAVAAVVSRWTVRRFLAATR